MRAHHDRVRVLAGREFRDLPGGFAEGDVRRNVLDALGLLPFLDAGRRLVFVDAVDGGAPPGTPVHIDDATRLSARSDGLSPRDVDLRDLQPSAQLMGHAPVRRSSSGCSQSPPRSG